MMRNVKELHGLDIVATDGAIGSVEEFYFDDERWTIRYLVVDTGMWLPGRKVLISPISIGRADWNARTLSLSVTRQQVRDSPDADTHKPLSRRYEAEYHRYYGYPYYWGTAQLWGRAPYPAAVPTPQTAAMNAQPEAQETGDDHLRRTKEVIGYHLDATDGEVGRVTDLLVDDQDWAIRYLVVNTGHWWSGHDALVSPAWITNVSWPDRKVSVRVTRAQIKDAPLYDSAAHIDRRWENDYFAHYREPVYWTASEVNRSEANARHDTATRLVSLNAHGELKVADDERDPRGWAVKATGDDRVVGKVDDLIVDTATMKVCYFDVELRNSTPDRNTTDRHILLPVLYARLGDAERCVTVDVRDPDDLGRLPPYAALPVTTQYDEEFRRYSRDADGSSRARRARATAAEVSTRRHSESDK